MLLATAKESNVGPGSLTQKITKFGNSIFLMPCPEPHVWCAVINHTPQHAVFLEKSFLSGELVSPYVGATDWDRPRVSKCGNQPQLCLAVRKRRVKCVNDWPTSLDELCNLSRCPHTTPPPTTTHTPDFLPWMQLLLWWETHWIIVQVSASRTWTGNNLLSKYILIKRYNSVVIKQCLFLFFFIVCFIIQIKKNFFQMK